VTPPLTECEQREAKSWYAKAHAGKLNNFPGIDSSYEVPLPPDEHLLTHAALTNQLA
jgi:adenylylsulfate kinase